MAENCFSSSEIRDAIRSSVKNFPSINELKPEQILVIENIVRGKDVFAALPTGFGKSLTFQILPAVKKSLERSSVSHLVIVVCPLNSIIKNQVNYLRSLGLKAAFVGESDEINKQIIEGSVQIDILYGSPESFVGDDKFRQMFANDMFRKNVVAVVCDEVHTVVHWGERGSSKKNPFRKWCGAVGEIRSLLPQGVPMLALTATASADTRKKIIDMLSLHKSVQIVVSPNRDNIKLYLQKVTNEISDNFMWLVHELEQKLIECPKLLIYVRDYQRCSEIYHLFMQSLGAKAYYPPCATKTSENRMVAMYHSGTSPSIQEIVLASLSDPNGKIRIIIATTALGMGVDIKGLHRIINYGPPSDIESYMQELGRAGRDGKQSEALLMFHGRQLHHCTPEMLEYLKSSTCRRSKLLELFDKGT
ncbi:ATP-dependent DNA helicase RecQ-like, partial [Acropora millepora]|uniref:ATP-dependent DNA helicase RecQ-like n=1 Tax=Acropora millepora TaxID=45264 RepID=UPI001CF10629